MSVNVGLDIGIASVGVAVVDSESGEILEAVSDLFESAEANQNVDRRGFRQSRRLKRRQYNRIHDFMKLWEEFGFVKPENINLNTVGLRVKSLTEQVTLDELYVILLSELKHRGISYLEDSEEVDGGSEYKEGLRINQRELQSKYPCEIQLERLKIYGRYRGNFTVEIDGEKVGLSNVFTTGAYRKEIQQLLSIQKTYQSKLTDDFINKYLEIFDRKRQYYVGPGNEKSRTDYGRYTTKKDAEGNYITDENIFEKLIGKCSIYPEEMRAAGASYTAQEFNLLNDLNNLTIGGRKIEEEEKRAIIETIKSSKVVNVEKIICKVTGEDAETITGARIDKDDKRIYHSFECYRKLKKALETIEVKIEEYSREELDELARILTLNTEREGILGELEKSFLDLGEEVIDCVIDFRRKNGPLFSKWQSFSLRLMNDIIPDMYEQPKEQMTLLTEMGLMKSKKEIFKGMKYIPENVMRDDIYNPVVVRSVRIAVRALNAVIKKYGEIDKVVIEMPRDRNTEEQKKRIDAENKRNREELPGIEKRILEEYGIKITSAHYRNHKQLGLKLKLWNEQGGICPYSGKTIDLERLLQNAGDYEVDHIIPLSISLDDSRNNKVLVYASENQKKGNQTPYAYLSSVQREWGWEQYRHYVLSDLKKKKISSKKIENYLFMKDISKIDVVKGFIQRNLNDTRYASKVVLNTLESFFKANEKETKVSVIRGSFTSLMRKNLKLDKSREESYAHHAVDALLIAYSTTAFAYRWSMVSRKFAIRSLALNTSETRVLVPCPIRPSPQYGACFCIDLFLSSSFSA